LKTTWRSVCSQRRFECHWKEVKFLTTGA
jgi:hypothetical protein